MTSPRGRPGARALCLLLHGVSGTLLLLFNGVCGALLSNGGAWAQESLCILDVESGSAGLGFPYPTAVGDPLQALLSASAFPPVAALGTDPDRAFGLEPGADERTWTLTIRRPTDWGRGAGGVTAAAIAASLERLLAPRTASPYAFLFRHVVGFAAFRAGSTRHVEGLAVRDEKTLEILLTEPDPAFPMRMAHPSAGLVLWSAENPRRPPRGPSVWIPGYGRPAPVGLASAVWSIPKAPRERDLPYRLQLEPGPVPGPAHILELRDAPVDPSDVFRDPGTTLFRLAGPPLPADCAGTQADGQALFKGASLALLLIRPAEGDEAAQGGGRRGLARPERLRLARRLAAAADLLPAGEGFRKAEGFLENPAGSIEALLGADAESGLEVPWSRPSLLLFYPSGDPLLQCLARRVEAVVSDEIPVRIYALPRAALLANLHGGDFDLMILQQPSMAWTPWESAGACLGLLAPYLGDAMLRAGGDAWTSGWLRLPVARAQAEPQARRLESALIATGMVLPLGWIETDLLLVDPPSGDARVPPDLPWWVLETLAGPSR